MEIKKEKEYEELVMETKKKQSTLPYPLTNFEIQGELSKWI